MATEPRPCRLPGPRHVFDRALRPLDAAEDQLVAGDVRDQLQDDRQHAGHRHHGRHARKLVSAPRPEIAPRKPSTTPTKYPAWLVAAPRPLARDHVVDVVATPLQHPIARRLGRQHDQQRLGHETSQKMESHLR